MEKVFELCEREEYDLVIVDTPPAAHALDFLEAPQRMVEFLESRIVQMLIHPAMAAGRFGFKIFQRGARRVLHLVERISGIGFLEDISEFLMAFEHMSEGFRDRALKVRELLLGPDASFVLVTGPAKESALQAEQFLDRLEATGVPLAGVLVNRVRCWPGDSLPEALASDRDADPADLAALAAAFRENEGADFPAEAAAEAAVAAATGYADLVRRDLAVNAALEERTRGHSRHWGTIPELAHDIHDLDGLARIADMIFRPPEEEPPDGNSTPDRPRNRTR
jgi:anion-transporting  ArsA/GET3 family ATPase